MKKISEVDWESAIVDMESKLNEMVMSPDVDFNEMFDCEIILLLLKGGLKLCKDEKNKI